MKLLEKMITMPSAVLPHAVGSLATSLVGGIPALAAQTLASSLTDALQESSSDPNQSSDVFFEKRLLKAEMETRKDAEDEALANLPRPDAAVFAEYPRETVIKKLGLQIFLDWVQHVRRNAEQLVQRSAVAANEGLSHAQNDLHQLNMTRCEIAELQLKKREHRSDEGEPTEQVMEYSSLLKRGHYLLLAALLVMVDWIANVPVFKQLFPQDALADQRWVELSSHAERYGLLSGLYTLLARLCFSPEVSVLAFGLVVFLMVLGHFSGSSLRRILVLKAEPNLSGSAPFAIHRKQAWFPFVASVTASVLIVAFLFLSRSKIETVAQERVAAATAQLVAFDAKYAEAQRAKDPAGIDAMSQDLDVQRGIVAARSKDAEYASAISLLNVPILLLNLVLVLTAAAAAYLESRDKVTHRARAEAKPYDLGPELGLREKARKLRSDLVNRDRDIEENISRARRLCLSTPLEGWRAKAERLDGLVSIFRAENARRRALHVSSIVTFQHPNPIEWPAVDDSWSCEFPSTLLECESKLNALRLNVAKSDLEEIPMSKERRPL